MDSQHYLGMIVDVLKDWYPDEYDMLIFLANGDVDDFEAFAKESRYFINHLIGYGLVNMSSNGYSFNIESIRDYLVTKHKYERMSMSYEQKIAEISERRNSLETKLRKILRNQLKGVKGRKNASNSVLASLTENRRSKYAGFDIDQLLHPDDSPLFFSELKSIITREWDTFQNIFEMDKQKLLVVLDELNDGRIDAHAKGIKDDQFAQLRIHFNNLENLLGDWL